MAGQRTYGLLSAGVIAIIFGATLYLSIVEVVSLVEVPSLILLFSGIWVLFIALLRAMSPASYEMGAFSTAGWGILLSSVGALWFLTFRGYTVDFVIVVFFIVIGILLLAAGLREWSARGKEWK